MSGERGLLLGKIAALVATPFALHGLWRGGFRKLVMLLTTILLAWGADACWGVAGSLVESMTGSPSKMGTGAALFLCSTVMWLVAHRVSKSIRRRRIEPHGSLLAVDRLTGALIGAAEGLFLVLCLSWAATSMRPAAERLVSARDVQITQTQREVAETILTLADEAQTGELGKFIARTNPLERLPALRDAVERLNNPSLQDDQLDPDLLRRLQEHINSSGGALSAGPSTDRKPARGGGSR